jgi:hypothetical protein
MSKRERQKQVSNKTRQVLKLQRIRENTALKKKIRKKHIIPKSVSLNSLSISTIIDQIREILTLGGSTILTCGTYLLLYLVKSCPSHPRLEYFQQTVTRYGDKLQEFQEAFKKYDDLDEAELDKTYPKNSPQAKSESLRLYALFLDIKTETELIQQMLNSPDCQVLLQQAQKESLPQDVVSELKRIHQDQTETNDKIIDIASNNVELKYPESELTETITTEPVEPVIENSDEPSNSDPIGFKLTM